MISRHPLHRVGVVLPDEVVPSDLSIPCDVFRYASAGEGPLYEVCVCGNGPVDTGLFTIVPHLDLSALESCHTVIVPGVQDPSRAVVPELVDALRQAHARGARVASICTGAFLLAAAGLLDGRRATTHWAAAQELARRYPSIDVDPDVLWVDEGQLLTSAGAAAGLDLCLHVVRKDHGDAIASHTARMAVMPLSRPGGQAQFIEYSAPDEPGSLQPMLLWIQENPMADLRASALARRHGMSTRTLSRFFERQTGTTPADWVRMSRVRHAQRLLETTELSVERVAEQAGFGGSATLRQQFARRLQTTPLAYRKAYR